MFKVYTEDKVKKKLKFHAKSAFWIKNKITPALELLSKILDTFQWCRQNFQLMGSECCFYPQNPKTMEH